MIRVSAHYPAAEGATFDHDYYASTHLDLVKDRWAQWLRRGEIDRGVAGAGGAPAPYLACGYLYFDSMEDFQAAMEAHGEEILGDIANFTTAEPVLQISEMTVSA